MYLLELYTVYTYIMNRRFTMLLIDLVGARFVTRARVSSFVSNDGGRGGGVDAARCEWRRRGGRRRWRWCWWWVG